jgi:hypothetical protein
MLLRNSISARRATRLPLGLGDAQVTAVRIVVLGCAISAGIHVALTPEHFAEGSGAGAGFLAAAVLLGALAIALTQWPTSALALAAAVPVLAGLIGSYALAVTTGLPLLHPEVEPLDGVALFTKGVEAAALAALVILLPPRLVGAATPRPKGTLR